MAGEWSVEMVSSLVSTSIGLMRAFPLPPVHPRIRGPRPEADRLYRFSSRDSDAVGKTVPAYRISRDWMPWVDTRRHVTLISDHERRRRVFGPDPTAGGHMSLTTTAEEDKYPLTWCAPRDLNPEPAD